MKRLFIHGLVAGVLAAIAGVIYLNLYQSLFYVSFDAIINEGSIIGSSILGCVLMALGYMLLEKFNQEKLHGVLNLVITTLSFATILGPMTMSLPLDIEFPELFPGLVVPMHFFPALSFMNLYPFFQKK